jgi:ubiquinone/menaquinone biosynthesis C-methylase UbiE
VRSENRDTVSLEALVESGDLGLPVLHPGGLQSTRELAELCQIRAGKQVLDVASGTGESACYLAQNFGCSVIGLDHSAAMVETAKRKALDRCLTIEFQLGNAHDLPFASETFDAAISECTTCALNKQRAIDEMARVTRRGGYVGISDLYWKEHAPEPLKTKLADLENERPETVAGWVALFEHAGLRDVQTKDLSDALARMSREMRKQMGIARQLRAATKVVRRWGIAALVRIESTERIFRSRHLGYAIVVGRKA